MQILNLQLHLPCQKMTLYNFLIAAKTPEGRYLPNFGCACSPVKQSGIAELQAGTLDVRGKKFVGKVQPTARFVLRTGGFLQYQYHKLKLRTTCPAFPTLMGFCSLRHSFICVYLTSHCGHHSERRMLDLYCTTYCTAVGTVIATKGLKDWKGNVQSFCPVMKIAMNANYL